MNYININQILFKNQYGFRKNHSTSLALINLYDKISTGFDASEHTVGVFLDLSKAFDTVDHEILISKLKHYGIRGLALDWIKNYLFNRMQYVQYNGICSLFNTIKCSVPQGSILGTLLFLTH
jgi:retron-type reverse transcriptase